MKAGRVEVTGGFLFLIAWLNYLDRQCIVPLALLACALHEAGHLLILKSAKADIKRIRITAVGAEIEFEDSLSYWLEGAAALAGPGINLLLALLCSARRDWELFVGLNLALGCFNLMPVSCLDGGRALFCILAVLIGPAQAQSVAQKLDFMALLTLAVFSAAAACRWGNITLPLAAIWMAFRGIRQKRRD